jgi:hypothetical protein
LNSEKKTQSGNKERTGKIQIVKNSKAPIEGGYFQTTSIYLKL